MTAGEIIKGTEQEISTISRSLSIAKELNVPVIALSQLSRAVETRGEVKDLYYLTFVNLVQLSKT